MAISKIPAASAISGTLPSSTLPTGSVVQTVNYTFTNYTQTSSTSFTDVTGSGCSFTPTFATSKVLLIINLVGITKNSGSNTTGAFQLTRNGSAILNWDALTGYTGSTTTWSGQSSANYLDSPATTSAITYKIQWKMDSGGTLQINNYNTSPGYSTSTITIMEIAG